MHGRYNISVPEIGDVLSWVDVVMETKQKDCGSKPFEPSEGDTKEILEDPASS